MTTLDTTAGRATRVRALLACGVIAGPLYVGTSLVQAFTRPGFDMLRHPWSALANGDLGWVQVTNLIVTGALLVAFGAGLRHTTGGRWAPALVAVFGLSMVVAGLFPAGPVPGFPVGTVAPVPVPASGLVHFAAGAIGFVAVAAACLLLGTRYAAARRPGRAWFCRVTAVAFLVAFAGLAGSGGSPAGTLGFIAALVLLLGCLATVATDALRTV
ncbi:hypothetical protein BJF78_20745 [Pseudonocardia sp. CNS-139]|nr:hypothetical protein BJF78_20745 [Pseudonocardia sp. CNS-139]